MKTVFLLGVLILLASCGKGENIGLENRNLNCSRGYNGLICIGDNINCEQVSYDELACTFTYSKEG